jgi:hypothetical protein
VLPRNGGQCAPACARTIAAVAVFGVIALSGCTCESRSTPSQGEPAGVRWACGEPPEAASFRLLAPGEQPGEDEPVLFAIELGRALHLGNGLLLPYLAHDGKVLRAQAVLVSSTATARTFELGDVHGDSAPPEVALSGRRAVFAVMDHDASGESYRLGQVWLDQGASEVSLSAEIGGGADRSPSFDVAAREDSALLAWDDWDSTEARGVVRGAWVSEAFEQPKTVRLSPESTDVESPRVVLRKDGYYVAWVANGEPEPNKPSAAAQGGGTLDEPVVRVNRRWIQLLALDALGVPSGPPMDVTSRDGFVVGFDVVAGHSDSLLFAYRDDKSAPGISGGVIHTAMVSVGGTPQVGLAVEEEVGSGIPSLTFDADPGGGAPHGWLSYTQSNGETRLLALLPDGAPVDMGTSRLELDEDVLLGAHAGRVMIAHPEGRNIVLSERICRPERRTAEPELPPHEVTE